MDTKYIIIEDFGVEKSLCSYFYKNGIRYTMSGVAFKNKGLTLYEVCIPSEEATYITLVYPEVKIRIEDKSPTSKNLRETLIEMVISD